MWKRIWYWRLWDELKTGKEVFAVILKGKRPQLRCVSDFSVKETADMLQQYSEENGEILFFGKEVTEDDD